MKVLTFNEFKNNPIHIDTLCLGTFDGLHIGHQELIRNAVFNSSGDVAVLLFDKHPSSFVGQPVKEIMTLDDKIRFLEKFRIDYVILVSVDKNFFNLTKDKFIEEYIKIISPNMIYVGEDYRFGFNGEGKPSYLNDFYPVTVNRLLTVDNEKVSSSRIREFLLNGDIDNANRLLGYPFEIVGKVEKGLQNGVKFGFPTANISLLDNLVLPKKGVYACITFVSGVPYKSMVNVGVHPTIDEIEKPIIESHLFNYSGDLYNKTIYIQFLSRIRDEKKFASIDELIDQLSKDKISCIDKLNY